MDSIRARAACTAASLLLLAGLAACGDRVHHTKVPQAQQSDVDAVVGVENKQVERAAHVDTLGAKGDTSVMDPDVLIAEQVKAALATRPEFGSSAEVDVRSRDGDVTLRGRAPDPSARERATEVARSIHNVRSVDNQLTVG